MSDDNTSLIKRTYQDRHRVAQLKAPRRRPCNSMGCGQAGFRSLAFVMYEREDEEADMRRFKKTDPFQCDPGTSAEHQSSFSGSRRSSGFRSQIATDPSSTACGYSAIVRNL